ncbi:uncharacterized protein LOC131848972 [Achroia grisella]|uniref:uncharacterized protein LOC131848972 n=1 Tax=Achroia grisella TaxID=688607 RepID=UPI0027D20FBF|nr:uncharacterized protein LOC131848972 [Achroia grisella]
MWKPIILDVECIVCNKSLQKINHDPKEVRKKMGKIINRRSRTPNWSIDEKQYLLELIKQRKDAVVTKNNNGPNYSEEKDVAWNEILRELASRFGNKFSTSSIKKVKTQWQNMKRIAREEIASVGPAVEKFTRQSLEVCNILDLVQDGVLKDESLNDTTLTTNVVIKAERIDDEINQASCSGTNTFSTIDNQQNSMTIELGSLRSSSTEQISETNDYDSHDERIDTVDVISGKKNASCMTDAPYPEEKLNNNPFETEFKEFLRYTAVEKKLKMDSLQEERFVVKAMRETAELNKITAEQRLKHVLWVKRQEMAMYSGEPGSGAGKGGGGGGSIREAGGSFGKMEAAREDEYFYKKQKEQIQSLRGHLSKEIAFHQEQIKRHEDAIRRHKEQMTDIEKK